MAQGIFIRIGIIAFMQIVAIVFRDRQISFYKHLIPVLISSDIVLGFSFSKNANAIIVSNIALFVLAGYTIFTLLLYKVRSDTTTVFKKFNPSEVILITDVTEFYRKKGINDIAQLYNLTFLTYSFGWLLKNAPVVVDPKLLCKKEWNSFIFYNDQIENDQMFEIKNGELYNEYIEEAYRKYVDENGKISKSGKIDKKNFSDNVQKLLDVSWEFFARRKTAELTALIKTGASFNIAKKSQDFINPAMSSQDLQNLIIFLKKTEK